MHHSASFLRYGVVSWVDYPTHGNKWQMCDNKLWWQWWRCDYWLRTVIDCSQLTQQLEESAVLHLLHTPHTTHKGSCISQVLRPHKQWTQVNKNMKSTDADHNTHVSDVCWHITDACQSNDQRSKLFSFQDTLYICTRHKMLQYRLTKCLAVTRHKMLQFWLTTCVAV